jgi:hypothetical protein
MFRNTTVVTAHLKITLKKNNNVFLFIVKSLVPSLDFIRKQCFNKYMSIN